MSTMSEAQILDAADAVAEILSGTAKVIVDFAKSEHADALLAAALRYERRYNHAEARASALTKLDGQWTTSVGSFVQSAVTSC